MRLSISESKIEEICHIKKVFSAELRLLYRPENEPYLTKTIKSGLVRSSVHCEVKKKYTKKTIYHRQNEMADASKEILTAEKNLLTDSSYVFHRFGRDDFPLSLTSDMG